jgi:hypothetical protein
MSEKCPECNCQLDLAEGETSDCCCGKRIERRDGKLVAAGTATDAS